MEPTPVCSPLIIAAEINFYKEQTRKITLLNCSEIGRRLREAKRLIPHGEWGNWLEDQVKEEIKKGVRHESMARKTGSESCRPVLWEQVKRNR